MALMKILLDVMLPADPVWTRVQNIDRGYLKQSDRLLRVQLPYRDGNDKYNQMHHAIATRVSQCTSINSILPPKVPKHASATSHKISVFMASSLEDVQDNLTEIFLQFPARTGEAVQVVQLSHLGEQRFGGRVFQEALAEVLILGFSEYLFVTPRVRGRPSVAYDGLNSWFVDWRSETSAIACRRAQKVDFASRFR